MEPSAEKTVRSAGISMSRLSLWDGDGRENSSFILCFISDTETASDSNPASGNSSPGDSEPSSEIRKTPVRQLGVKSASSAGPRTLTVQGGGGASESVLYLLLWSIVVCLAGNMLPISGYSLQNGYRGPRDTIDGYDTDTAIPTNPHPIKDPESSVLSSPDWGSVFSTSFNIPRLFSLSLSRKIPC